MDGRANPQPNLKYESQTSVLNSKMNLISCSPIWINPFPKMVKSYRNLHDLINLMENDAKVAI